jgi:hypothetical protein
VGTWKVQTTPNPATAEVSTLASVACPSRRDCIAVGSSAATLSSPTLTLAERWDGRRWQMQAIPTPKGTSDTLFGISCPSTHACMTVGSAYYLKSRRQTILTETWNGQQWQVRSAPVINAPDSSLSAVSCVSATSCMAVGASQPRSGSQPIVEQWDGTRWRAEQIPGPTKGVTLSAVSCSGARACVAVGLNTASGNARPLAESWNGKNWQVQAVPLPQGIRGGMFEGVSCTSSRACMATGSDFDHPNGPTLAERWNGKTWRVEPTPNPPNFSASFAEVTFDGVSCSSANACTTVGIYNPGNAAAYFIESWNGKRWRLEPAPHPADFEHGVLLGISCASGRCTAVGGYTGRVRVQVTLSIGK